MAWSEAGWPRIGVLPGVIATNGWRVRHRRAFPVVANDEHGLVYYCII